MNQGGANRQTNVSREAIAKEFYILIARMVQTTIYAIQLPLQDPTIISSHVSTANIEWTVAPKRPPVRLQRQLP